MCRQAWQMVLGLGHSRSKSEERRLRRLFSQLYISAGLGHLSIRSRWKNRLAKNCWPRNKLFLVGRDSVEPPLPDLARLLFRQKLVGQARRWPKQFNPAGGNALPYNLLAKPRIEVETAGIFNFDFAEIVMVRIEKKSSLSRHNHTRNRKNHGLS